MEDTIDYTKPDKVCIHCGLPVKRSSNVTWNGPKEWVHLDGGYHLCIIEGKRPGLCAEPE